MISFGFNTASVYDVNDKNAFIYRLVKEQIETIDIDDSDDENDAAPPPNKVKIIEISNKVIDIDSDSDSNYSGNECFQNIEEMEEEESSSSSCMIEGDASYSDEDSQSNEMMESDEENFVVTKTILKCATPTETIALDEDDDDDDVPETIAEKPTQSEESNDKSANGVETKGNDVESTEIETESKKEDAKSMENEAKSNENNAKSVENEAESKEENATRTKDVTGSVEKDKPSPKSDKKSETDKKSESEKNYKKSTTTQKVSTESDTQASTSKNTEINARLERVRRNLVEKAPKQTAYTKPQKLRKRRQTISEEEYNQRKLTKKLDIETQKLLRREKLAKIAEKEKMKHDEAAAAAANIVRIPNIPKVKNIISRGEQLCTDMMAIGSLNPNNTENAYDLL